ncbi:helix-turn-helix domain-containing protein [Rhodococcus sp. T2V]|uniref:helix-turn-helix domain-containing protein n=1 Tax=Rhodococcus sp. T2V TaxID=3034164 RepID=UPI0023E0C6FC|nr:helix-turn-helix domain-containing protein [Rhodococcus sp. T2V]MDF3311542.1 helix-turn-helix domain-containing protein [Rhodococcus sp. T2V]
MGAQLRYQYRVYPTPGQQDMLARSFGCARVVFNDCLRIRQDAYAAGVSLSDTAVQKRVVTAAKKTPERAWLGEVASVVLVEDHRDLPGRGGREGHRPHGRAGIRVLTASTTQR